MPFGLKNAPATFQRIIQKIRGQLLYKGAINSLDDVILYSKSFDEHVQLIDKVLTIFESHNIKLKEKKCHSPKNPLNTKDT